MGGRSGLVHQQTCTKVLTSPSHQRCGVISTRHVSQLSHTAIPFTRRLTRLLTRPVIYWRTTETKTVTRPLPTAVKMCKYYAYTHPCGHTCCHFAKYCPDGAIAQRQCGHDRSEIWNSVRVEYNCPNCPEEPKPSPIRQKNRVGRRVARR